MGHKLFALLALSLTASAAAAIDYDSLKAGDTAHGFRATTIYLDDGDRPVGARFRHLKSGYTLDLLKIESVPQSYTWVNSYPVSDQGEPHTQEHLLLGKGLAGRELSALQTMSMVSHSAFTQQWRTSYVMNTEAGADVFFDMFAQLQKAMLHPDYSDEEIRREVRHFGVTQNADGRLRLEEQGSVYNEMVSSSATPFSKVFRTMFRMIYGEKHPFAYNSGGEPSGIRTMKPKDIRDFHRATHYLANMGTIAAFPASVPLDTLLTRFDRVLLKDSPAGTPKKAQAMEDLPRPQPAPRGAIRIVDYPQKNEQQPSPFLLAWPGDRDLDANEQVLIELFAQNLASDPTTNLYKLLIDSKTRKLDLGARSVSASVLRYGGYPMYVSFTDVPAANLTEAKLGEVRKLVMDEIARVAGLPDDSADLRAFNERIASRVIENERDLAKFIGTPPRFGFRSIGSNWMDHTLLLERTAEPRKSLTLKPQFAFVRALLESRKNFWREYLAKWRITAAEPYVVAARPSPALQQQDDDERGRRIAEETSRLQQRYKLADAQEAIKRYRTEMDAGAAAIEAEAKKVKQPPFVKSPPMTLDDELRYEVATLANGVPLVASRFDSMTGAFTGIALKVDGVPRDELRYLSLLPQLLTRVGVIENGNPVSFDEMTERQRKEILSLQAAFAVNARTGRVELVVRGAGTGQAESERALEWMALVLHSPDWRPENLARIRDVVDQAASQLRNTQQQREEAWVQNPEIAWRMQRIPAALAAESFLTATHNALRLRWMLKDPAPADAEPLRSFMTLLAEGAKSMPRPAVKALLASGKAPGLEALSPEARALAIEAMKDIDLALVDTADASFAADFEYLAKALRDDLLAPASAALARLEVLRRGILRSGGARMFMASSGDLRKAMAAKVEAFAARLDKGAAAARIETAGVVEARLREREPDAVPVHVALYTTAKPGGVIMSSVPGVHYSDFADAQKQLDYLASRLHAGGGPQSIFLKTIGAGLAYSNGLRGSIGAGRRGYYAERTPELPQTVRFVVNTLRNSPVDPLLGDYALTVAFGESRAAATYEARAEGIANDLADAQPPELVRKFRESLLELRKDPMLGAVLFDRKDRVYGEALPGYDGKGGAPTLIDFVIGPDKQLDAWERYLRNDAGGAKLYRIYARDFWMP